MKKSEMKDSLNDYLLEEKEDEKSKNTLKHYEHILLSFFDAVPDEIDKESLIHYKESLIQKYRPKTVNNYITVINKFLKYMEIKDDPDFSFYKLKKHYSKNVLKNIKLQNESSLEDVLEPVELKRMLRKAKEKEQMDIYFIMKIFAYTGIRAEELKVFTVENIKSNYILVSNKGKTRNIIIRQDLRRDLMHYCKENHIKTGYIFPGKNPGTMIHESTIYKRMKKIASMCRGIKLSKVHPHSFRHLFAIQFLDEGGNISELADILGHSSIETTRIYTRTTDAMKRKKMEKMKY